MKNVPIADLHCDLTYYLFEEKDADIMNVNDIGVAVPHLQKGNVNFQVMAIYTATQKGSVNNAIEQSRIYQQLSKSKYFEAVNSYKSIKSLMNSDKTGMVLSIESAAGICEEDMPLDNAFKNIETIIKNGNKRLFYISFTHHEENRFGGGNYSDNVGLKKDGEALLDYLDRKEIAVDFAHSSDALAFDILNYIDKNNLVIPVIASHSNFRSVLNHARNLPDELTDEIIRRKGLIGINFVRTYIHNEKPEAILDHIAHGIEKGAQDNLCMGADFFYAGSLHDQSTLPEYFEEHQDASKYPSLLKSMNDYGFTNANIYGIAHQNFLNFIKRNWKKKTAVEKILLD